MIRLSQFGLFSKEATSGERQKLWAYELNDFSFDIILKLGKEQIQSDALSRRE